MGAENFAAGYGKEQGRVIETERDSAVSTKSKNWRVDRLSAWGLSLFVVRCRCWPAGRPPRARTYSEVCGTRSPFLEWLGVFREVGGALSVPMESDGKKENAA